MKVPQIGTVSEGTLEPYALLRAFVSALEDLIEVDDETPLGIQETLEVAHIYMGMDEDHDLTPEEAEELAGCIEELEEWLNDAAPPYVRFSAQDGDGALFGFWPDVDCAILDAENGELLRTRGSVPSLLLDVNDHGNVTLYEVSVKEIWSTV